MIQTPSSFADTPDRPAAGDLLSEMLRALRLTGSVFLNGSVPPPLRIFSPKRFDERTPLARLRHISIFHLVAHGRCTFQTATGKRHDVEAGDILLMPFTDTHTFWNGETAETVSAFDIV